MKSRFKIIICCLVMVLSVGVLAGCTTAKDLEGYWMNNNGETITLNRNGSCYIDSVKYTYELSKDDSIRIYKEGNIFKEYSFVFNEDENELALTMDGESVIYTRDEDKQTKIISNLATIKELKAEKAEIEKDIDAVDSSIVKLEEKIEEKRKSITARIEDTEYWESKIEQQSDSHKQDTLLNGEYSNKDLNSHVINMYKTNMQDNFDEIDRLEKDIEDLKEDIEELESKKSSLSAEIAKINNKLKEYE